MTSFDRTSDLVIDLGMNNGDDTAYYLRRGHRVVAVEANPVLVEIARLRFSGEIGCGALVILNKAIWETLGSISFLVNEDNDHWSSIDPGWAGRDDSRYQSVDVATTTIRDLFGAFGVPLYLKIDVEGVDHIVLRQLEAESIVPAYVSIEDCRFGFDYIETLGRIGYDGFKLLDQSNVPTLTDETTSLPFPTGSSGPFGEDVPGHWVPRDEIVKSYSSTVRSFDGARIAPRTQWWDIHGTKLA